MKIGVHHIQRQSRITSQLSYDADLWFIVWCFCIFNRIQDALVYIQPNPILKYCLTKTYLQSHNLHFEHFLWTLDLFNDNFNTCHFYCNFDTSFYVFLKLSFFIFFFLFISLRDTKSSCSSIVYLFRTRGFTVTCLSYPYPYFVPTPSGNVTKITKFRR